MSKFRGYFHKNDIVLLCDKCEVRDLPYQGKLYKMVLCTVGHYLIENGEIFPFAVHEGTSTHEMMMKHQQQKKEDNL